VPDPDTIHDMQVMNQRFILFRRAGVFYCEDTTTRKQLSLRTKDEGEAKTLLHAKNESFRQPILNLQLARTYMAASDPLVSKRTWQSPMDAMTKTKTGTTRVRHERAMKDTAFDTIRNLPIVETNSAHFLDALAAGTVATNVFLRRIHNFALDMGWLPWPVLPKKQWPKIRFNPKRAVTAQEHQAILAAEKNPERRAFYALCWLLGGSQSDVANITAEDIDWQTKTVSFYRRKNESPAIIRFGAELETILQGLPTAGALFPSLKPMRESHRATEFKRACKRLKLCGITLHSYRYSWAERARSCGYPERFAQEALGHQSKAVHRAYARKAQVTISTLEEYEKRAAAATIIPLPTVAVNAA
jgi:integrase